MNVLFRGKPIESLTRDEAIDGLKQALERVAELEGKPGPVWYPLEPRDPRPLHEQVTGIRLW